MICFLATVEVARRDVVKSMLAKQEMNQKKKCVFLTELGLTLIILQP